MKNEPNSTKMRQFLIDELSRRCSRNPRYSLRSFANHLGVDPGNLSRAIRGKSKLSQKYHEKISHALGLSPVQRSGAQCATKSHDGAWEKFMDIDEARFETVADPIHYQILELTVTSGFQSNSKWISKRLGVLEPIIIAAINRLFKCGLLIRDDQGAYQKITPKISSSKSSSSAATNHQKKVTQQSLDSLDHYGTDKRCHVSMVMPIDASKIDYAREQIENFVAKLTEKLSSGERNQVYQIGVGLYPVSKGESDA